MVIPASYLQIHRCSICLDFAAGTSLSQVEAIYLYHSNSVLHLNIERLGSHSRLIVALLVKNIIVKPEELSV